MALKSIETELDKTRQTFILSNHYDSTEKQREFLESRTLFGDTRENKFHAAETRQP